MLCHRRISHATAVLACAVAAIGVVRAADALGGASPFAPPAAANAPGAGTPDAPLELRGITVAGGAAMFSIYDPSKHTSTWSKVNESGHDFIVRSYEADKDSVMLDYQGRALTLVLHTAKIAGAPASMAMPMPTSFGQTPMPQPAQPAVVLNPTQADEQRRLESIAAEVNRRRQLRMQAMQQMRQGQQPQPPMPGAAPPPPQ